MNRDLINSLSAVLVVLAICAGAILVFNWSDGPFPFGKGALDLSLLAVVVCCFVLIAGMRLIAARAGDQK